MKKIIIILSILALIASGCGQATKKQAETVNGTIAGQNNKIDEFVIEGNSDRKVKYFFQANGGSVVFFDDGTAYRCAQCDLDENLEDYKPNITYKEFPTYLLMEGNMDWQLYNEDGCIAMDWVIVDYKENHNKIAVEMLSDFYTQYITECDKMPLNTEAIDKIKEKFLTEELIQKLKTAELDYDPFLYAQDCDLSWLETFGIGCAGQDNAYYACYSYSPNHTRCVTLYLVGKDGYYLINDLEEFR